MFLIKHFLIEKVSKLNKYIFETYEIRQFEIRTFILTK